MLAGAAALLSGWVLRRALLASVAEGLAAAWAVSTASVAALVFAQRMSVDAFWWAFGGGVALRAVVMGSLMAWVWDAHWERQGALLGAYALGILFLLLLEYKNLIWK